MVLDREWLLGVARQEREALGRAIQYTAPDEWARPSPWRGRPLGAVLAHLAATEVAAAAWWAGEEATEVEEYAKTLPEREAPRAGDFSDWAVDRRNDQPIRTVAAEWGRAADLLLARASRTPEEEWREREVPWFGGDLRAGYFLQNRVVQWWIHMFDVYVGAGKPPRREHAPTFVVNDWAIRLIPYALSRAGHSFPGLSVEVELEETGGGVWHQSLQGAAVPRPEKRPDAYIQGRGHWFARLVAHRADVDAVLYEGLVNVGGNVEVAEAVVRSLRAFP